MNPNDERSLVPSPVEYHRAQTYRRPDFETYSIFEVLHYRYGAWSARAVNAAKTSVRASEQRLLEQEISLQLTGVRGRAELAGALLEAEEAEAEVGLRRSVRELPAPQARALLATETDLEKRLAGRDSWRAIRRNDHTERLLPAAPQQPTPAAELELDVSEREIEAESLRAFSTLATLPPQEVRTRYLVVMENLKSRYPEYAVADISSRVDRMLQAVQMAR